MPRRHARCGPTVTVETFAAHEHVVLATGGVGQCFAVTTNPTLSTGDGIALALQRGRRVRRPRVRAVPPDRAAPPVDAAAAPVGGAARRGRGAPRPRRCRVHGRRAPTRRSRAARCRVACDPPTHARDRHRPRLPRRVDDRRLPEPLPDDLARVPVRRARPDAASYLPVAPGGALPLGRRRHRSRRRETLPHLWSCGEAGVQRRARRQPARVELVARRSGVRSPRRRGDRAGVHRCRGRPAR